MKAIRFTPLIVLLLVCGCGVFSSKLVRRSIRVVVVTEHAPAYAINSDASVGPAVGSLSDHAGDTITALGVYGGGLMEPTYHIVLNEGREVYVKNGDLLTEDDHLWSRSSPNIRMERADDQTAWGRAIAYIIHHSGTRIEISSSHLIQTEAPADTSSVSYLVTRIPTREWVEYSITCRSKRKGFDSIDSARRMAFFMASGHDYTPDSF
jgi:hypothetical protein